MTQVPLNRRCRPSSITVGLRSPAPRHVPHLDGPGLHDCQPHGPYPGSARAAGAEHGVLNIRFIPFWDKIAISSSSSSGNELPSLAVAALQRSCRTGRTAMPLTKKYSQTYNDALIALAAVTQRPANIVNLAGVYAIRVDLEYNRYLLPRTPPEASPTNPTRAAHGRCASIRPPSRPSRMRYSPKLQTRGSSTRSMRHLHSSKAAETRLSRTQTSATCEVPPHRRHPVMSARNRLKHRSQPARSAERAAQPESNSPLPAPESFGCRRGCGDLVYLTRC